MNIPGRCAGRRVFPRSARANARERPPSRLSHDDVRRLRIGEPRWVQRSSLRSQPGTRQRKTLAQIEGISGRQIRVLAPPLGPTSRSSSAAPPGKLNLFFTPTCHTEVSMSAVLVTSTPWAVESVGTK